MYSYLSIYEIYIAPLQGNYLEVLSVQARTKIKVLRSLHPLPLYPFQQLLKRLTKHRGAPRSEAPSEVENLKTTFNDSNFPVSSMLRIVEGGHSRAKHQ